MTTTIKATYVNGVFKPREAVALNEGAEVELTVKFVAEDQDPLEEVLGICDDGPNISLAARHDEFAYGTPMDEESSS
jgi:predicted DNA-binding antitoxin AbrB/MazE fold protein